MTSYVVFKIKEGREVYWDGTMTGTGQPTMSVDRGRALEFETARAGYDYAGQFEQLQSWKVGKR